MPKDESPESGASGARERLILALDVPDQASADAYLELLGAEVGVFKVGLELFSAVGPAAVERVHGAHAACFLDLKLHDIPKTMASATAVAVRLGVRYLTLHAAAGPAALGACAEAARGSRTQLLAVTVLTSLGATDLNAIGLAGPPRDAVLRMARLAREAGIDGLVCSAEECAALRRELGPEPLLVVPGIRPEGSGRGDQQRVATPRRAIADGASSLVVGRPIREAADPVAAARSIVAEIAAAGAR